MQLQNIRNKSSILDSLKVLSMKEVVLTEEIMKEVIEVIKYNNLDELTINDCNLGKN